MVLQPFTDLVCYTNFLHFLNSTILKFLSTFCTHFSRAFLFSNYFHVTTITDVYLNQKRVNVYEHKFEFFICFKGKRNNSILCNNINIISFDKLCCCPNICVQFYLFHGSTVLHGLCMLHNFPPIISSLFQSFDFLNSIILKFISSP